MSEPIVPLVPVRMVDVLEFAAIQGVDHRTVRDWLSKGLLPRAKKNERGKWMIPADERKLDRAPDTALENVHEIGHTHEPIPVPKRPRAYFTVTEAAALLAPLTERYIRAHKDTFEILEGAGPNGTDLVPGRVVRPELGLSS